MEPYGSAIVLATKRPGWQKRWKAVSDSVLLAYPRSQRTAACAPRKPRTLRVVAAQFKWGIEPEWLPNENCWSDSQVWKSVARPGLESTPIDPSRFDGRATMRIHSLNLM
jgi:hypothetical protein